MLNDVGPMLQLCLNGVWMMMVHVRAKWVMIEICEPNFKFDPNLKNDMLFGCCNAFQTMVNFLVVTWSSIRALLRIKLTFTKNVLKKSSKGRVNGLISKQVFFSILSKLAK